MANKFETNYPIIANFDVIWKLTRVMKAAGWLTVASSNGLTKVAPATNSTDSWGTNADPLLDPYPANFTTNAQWIVMRGPSTFKIPINVNPGNMLRGEKIVQAGSGAIGELIGMVFDSGSGYAVVAPRTGTFNSINTITGSSSGLSFTPSATIIEFVREIVFSRAAGNALLQCHYICADIVGENAQLFSTLATSTGCTATVLPGGGGTSNAYPALGICLRGTPGTATHTSFFNGSTTGYAQIGCANMIGSANETVDGSFYAAFNTSVAGNMDGFIFSKLDNTEPGDLDPYIFYFPYSATPLSWVRSTASTAYSGNTFSTAGVSLTTSTAMTGYQARGSGLGPKDTISTYTGATINIASQPVAAYFYTSSINVVTSPSSTPTYLRIPIWAVTNKQTSSLNYPQIKGSLKWMFFSSVGNKLDLFDGRKTLCVSSFTSNTVPALFVGLYDGVSVPLA